MTTLADHEPRVEIAVPRPHHHRPIPLAAHHTPSWYERRGKRWFDVVVALSALVVLAPLLAVIAVLLRSTLGPGVLLRQRRVGLAGRDFTMFKFRTMHPDRRRADRPIEGPDRRRLHKSPDDPRHTPIGRWLRSTSLDELPQLLNVVRGEMSLVGPRPELADIVDARGLRAHPRHRCVPGITGAWQIGHRNDGALLCECVDDPLATPTFRADLGVLIATIGVVVRRTGV